MIVRLHIRPAGSSTSCFFTIQSNLLVAVTSILLLIRSDRTSAAFWAFRLAGLVAITVTLVVFHLVLSRLYEFDGWSAVANQLIHTIAPLLAIAAWVVAGPRGRATPRIALLALLPAGAWLVFMLVRGELIDFYPYPFVDVGDLGYPRTLLNAVLVGLLFYGLARAATWLDMRLLVRAVQRDITSQTALESATPHPSPERETP